MILYVSFNTVLFKNIMMKISDTYFRITGYNFQDIDIHWCKNSQHSMLSLPDFNNINIYTFQR